MNQEEEQYELVQCENCKDMYLKETIEDHQILCLIEYAEVMCQYCGQLHLSKTIEEHYQYCTQKSLCQYCNEEIITRFLQEHYEECIEKLILDFQPIKKLQQIEECPICLVEFEFNDDKQCLECFHMYHKECLLDWQQKKGNANMECPICRHNTQLN